MLLRDHLLSVPDPAHRLKLYPVPNSAATLAIGLLALALPWAVAAKLWLCAQWGLSFYALRHLGRTVRASAAVWLVVPQAVFLNVNLWYGFVNFELGLAWVLLFASMLLRRRSEAGDGGRRRDWPIGLLLLLAFFTHMIPFTFCLLLLAGNAWQTRQGRLLWQTVPALALTAWYMLGRFVSAYDADGASGMVSSVTSFSAAFWEFKVNSYAKSFGLVNPGGAAAEIFSGSGLTLLFVVNAAVAVLAGVLLVAAARRAWTNHATDRFLWAAILLSLGAALVLPGATLGISDPGARVLQTALALALVLAFSGSLRWAEQGISSGSVVLTIAGLGLFSYAGFGRELSLYRGALRPEIAQFDHVPNRDQDYFYRALDRGDLSLRVFPTGMFLNR